MAKKQKMGLLDYFTEQLLYDSNEDIMILASLEKQPDDFVDAISPKAM